MSTTDKLQPPRIQSHHQSGTMPRRAVGLVLAFTLAIAAVILFTFDPVHSSFYPVCIFKKLTGWSCPACGCLRATHQILHGHFANAFRLNALFLVILPIVALLGVEQAIGKHLLPKRAVFGWTFLVLFILFGILRNLPLFSAWSGQ